MSTPMHTSFALSLFFSAALAWLVPGIAAQDEPVPVPERARVVPAQDTLESPPERCQKGFESFDPAVCREFLTFLASDDLQGRATGTPGYRKATEYVAKKFEEFGLEPVGDDGTYFQQVPWTEIGVDPDTSYLAVERADGSELERFSVASGLVAMSAAGNVDRTAPVEVFEEGAELGDVAGKFVILKTRPSTRRVWRALFRAGGMISVGGERVESTPVVLRGSRRERVRNAQSRRRLQFELAGQVAEKLARMLEESPDLQLHVHAEVQQKAAFGPNVVGYLEGADPELKAELVGIGSHLDHIGLRGASEDRICNGADDDGSGTTGVLAVARAFHINGVRPRRSILFMCFSGEELGLIGSKYYADNPIYPHDKMVAEIQMDMIGRREEAPNSEERTPESPDDNVNTLHLVGTKRKSMRFHELALDLNEKHVGFEFEYDHEGMFGRSDHANFARQGIPVAFLFTGLHPQYHQPDDEIGLIDFPKLTRVAQFAYTLAFEVADHGLKGE